MIRFKEMMKNMRLYAWFGSEQEVNEVIASAMEDEMMSANGEVKVGNKPVQKLSMGDVQLCVWENPIKTSEGKEFVAKSVSIQKSYKDKNGEWQHTHNFKDTDIWKVQAVLSRFLEGRVKIE